ncbi:hypothetical protein TNCV_855931 [Trichonephila clavipes]|nr:hypothetical protein TNCV_855931 [Trichonephila clavipes]
MWTRNYGALGQTARVCFGVLCANRTREVKRDFGDLPIRRDEGRVVNTPLVFKRVLFPGERKKEGDEKGRSGEEDEETRERERTKVGRGGRGDPGERTDETSEEEKDRESRERTDGRRRRGNGEETRGEDRRDGERKGLSPEIGEKKTTNAGGVANGI